MKCVVLALLKPWATFDTLTVEELGFAGEKIAHTLFADNTRRVSVHDFLTALISALPP
jgi:hypothetical protein